MKIGFIGQGYVGKSYADYFEEEGKHELVRYALEEPYVRNKEHIASCDIVFIGVPTPSTPKGFDVSIVTSAISLIGVGKTAVIKSTIVPGTTAALQKEFPDRTILYSPEFLSEATAAYDTAHPFSNIIGIASETPSARDAAGVVMKILPVAPHSVICSSLEAEIIKYSHNGSGYVQVVFFNMMYDLAKKNGSGLGSY
jgi:UDPglucose 6-dehydrogenase